MVRNNLLNGFSGIAKYLVKLKGTKYFKYKKM